MTLTPAPALGNPLHLTGVTKLDGRLSQYAFTTPAVTGTTDVRVLFPSGYASHRRRRYPVLYLLHGALDDDTAWTTKGQAEQLTASYPVIVVMPSSGTSGGYTNWYNGGRGGSPEWETYHIDQLIPWIDHHLRTRATRAERAIAGLSMGGFGAMSYAARHPDLFAAAASFSGAVDTNNALDIAITGNSIWGPRATQQVIWRAHNPWDLAGNLRGMNLTIRTGNGEPGGPLGNGAFGPALDPVEFAVHQMSISFHNRLDALGIPSTFDDYGPGSHAWPYWDRDLHQTLPTFMSVFAHPKTPPASFTFTAVEPQYSVYGWTTSMTRGALEFSTLRVTGRSGFTVSGSGTATVTTGRLYRPGARLRVTVNDAAGRHRSRLTATRQGRLKVSLNLGPSNTVQEYTIPAPRRSVSASVHVQVPGG